MSTTLSTNVLTRAEVYDRIDGELAYAHARWNADTTTSGGRHSPLEWLVYIEHYVNHAKTVASTMGDPVARDTVMEDLRKIAGLAVSAMEEHGVNPRQPSDGSIRVWSQSRAGGAI